MFPLCYVGLFTVWSYGFILIHIYECRGLVFEEEDFQPMMYGYRLTLDVTEVRAVGMLKEVEDELNRSRRLLQVDAADNVCFITHYYSIYFSYTFNGMSS